MFKPQYDLNKALVNHLSQIERLYGKLEALRIPKKLELNLERDNLVQSAYVSNSIEGNPLSHREVTNLLLSDRVAVNRDEKEVTNYFEILKSLPKYQDKTININLMNQFHKKLLTGINNDIAGQIRNKRVVVGKYLSQDKSATSLEVKHEPPHHTPKRISHSMKELFAWLKSDTETPAALKAGIFHHQFVFIHPYIDGNGRVCRLLTALVFLQNNYTINKYFVLDDYYDIDRYQYSDKLHTADKGDKTEWLKYFLKGVDHSLRAALSRVENAIFKIKIEQRPTNKEKQVLFIIEEQHELTSTDLATILKVSRQQAHTLLKSLVEKGFLQKHGITKKSYYTLK